MGKAKIVKWNHDKHIKYIRNFIEAYDKDDAADERLESCVCKFCCYSPPRVSTQGFETVECEGCKVEMGFHNGDVDKYCIECAELHNVCTHCGSEMD